MHCISLQMYRSDPPLFLTPPRGGWGSIINPQVGRNSNRLVKTRRSKCCDFMLRSRGRSFTAYAQSNVYRHCCFELRFDSRFSFSCSLPYLLRIGDIGFKIRSYSLVYGGFKSRKKPRVWRLRRNPVGIFLLFSSSKT